MLHLPRSLICRWLSFRICPRLKAYHYNFFDWLISACKSLNFNFWMLLWSNSLLQRASIAHVSYKTCDKVMSRIAKARTLQCLWRDVQSKETASPTCPTHLCTRHFNMLEPFVLLQGDLSQQLILLTSGSLHAPSGWEWWLKRKKATHPVSRRSLFSLLPVSSRAALSWWRLECLGLHRLVWALCFTAEPKWVDWALMQMHIVGDVFFGVPACSAGLSFVLPVAYAPLSSMSQYAYQIMRWWQELLNLTM